MLSKTNYNNNRRCNCRSKSNCTLNGECLLECLVYKVTSTTSSSNFIYYGTSEREFETWYTNHTQSFRHYECTNETELSKHCGTQKIMVLITVYHGKSKKKPQLFVGKSSHYLCWSRHYLCWRTDLISKCH